MSETNVGSGSNGPDNTVPRRTGPAGTADYAHTDIDLVAESNRWQQHAQQFIVTVAEVAAGQQADAVVPLLLLAVGDVSAAGARLGAMTDILPPDRFEPDAGPDADLDPIRVGLVNVLEGLDEYMEVTDPGFSPEVTAGSVVSDLVTVIDALSQGLRHFDAGRALEALWWWQFSYLSVWGERAASALRVLIGLLAHLRLDVDDDVAASAEFEALHP